MRAFLLMLAALVAAPAAAQTVPLIGGQPVGTAGLPPPDGFGHVPPFTVIRSPDGTYRHTFDVTTRRPTPTVTIFVGPGGDNSKDCLSWANRCRSLKQAMVRAGAQSTAQVVRVLAQAGIYCATNVDGSGIPDDFGAWLGARNLVVEPCDASGAPLPVTDGRFTRAAQVISSHEAALPTFTATADPRVYVATYTTQPVDRQMWDERYSNRFGRPVGLLTVPVDGVANAANSIAEINRAADTFGKGAFFLDTSAKRIWVRLSDNQAPDADLHISATGRQLYLAIGPDLNFTLYMRGVDQWGGYFQLNGWPNRSSWAISMVDTYQGYVTNGASLFTTAGSVVWERAVVSDYAIDAFGTGTEGTENGYFTWYELDTIAEWGGFTQTVNDGSANSSTQHRHSIGVSVNTVYRYNTNWIVHDIGDARSWRLGMTVGPSTCATQEASGLVAALKDSAKLSAVAVVAGYYDETGPQTTKVWVDGLTVVGPINYVLGAYNNTQGGGPGGVIYYRNVTAPDGVPNTVASPYAGQKQTATSQPY
ncbi:hypothetical protein [uncultured Sphingomonas sp.]|uniref:hypothetical protein n=1 Tax=uncultured Sphingomonas sp. TaxID=158754 RepID=UPI0025D9DE4E|nr:hypothetical protein [uncultured Sphingomonas sp.]